MPGGPDAEPGRGSSSGWTRSADDLGTEDRQIAAVGGPIEPGNLLRGSFSPWLDRPELPHVRFHDLRHTASTLMLSRGVHPKVASELLGHATVGITLDLYSRVSESMQREAARAMDARPTPG